MFGSVKLDPLGQSVLLHFPKIAIKLSVNKHVFQESDVHENGENAGNLLSKFLRFRCLNRKTKFHAKEETGSLQQV